jgi:hypothetical protein
LSFKEQTDFRESGKAKLKPENDTPHI